MGAHKSPCFHSVALFCSSFTQHHLNCMMFAVATIQTRSAPVTPDSIVGSSIRMTASFNDACSYNERHENKVASPKNQSDELLLALLHHESLRCYQLNSDYLYSNDRIVTERCRRRICEWMYGICDYLALNRDIVAIATFYVDRYFTLAYSADTPITTRLHQLVALTSLFIAIKTHGELKHRDDDNQDRVDFNISFCAHLSRNQFTPKEIEECEQSLLYALDWHVNPVVPSCVIDALINYLPPSLRAESTYDATLYVYECSKHLSELIVSIPAMSIDHKPSVLAFASIMYAIEKCDSDLHPSFLQSEFQDTVQDATCDYFQTEKEKIEYVVDVLRVTCPDLNGL